jgi:hypothetical protein
LAKIIPRLATGHEGEVTNTVGAINRIRIGARSVSVVCEGVRLLDVADHHLSGHMA